MQSGTILYAGTDLGLYGKPRFTLRKTADPAPPATATHWRVGITVSLSLSADMPATVWARARKVLAVLEAGGRRTLAVRDENGTVMSWEADAADFSSLTEAIARKQGVVEMNFTALQPMTTAGDNIAAVIDTLDDEDPLSIDMVMSWNESVDPVRPDERIADRTEIRQAITFSARASYADPTASAAERAEFLIAEKIRFEAAAGKEVELTFAGETRIVQFESIRTTPSDGWEFLTIEGQARRNVLPGGTTAEVTFEVDSTEDPATGETRISISGSVEAGSETLADTKIDNILFAYRTPGTRVTSIKKTDRLHDGHDATVEPTWLGLNFQIELVRNTGETRYTLNISDKEGGDGRRVTYSGSATASTLEILLATVETAAGGKHPVEISSELTITYATDDEGTANLVSATFTRDYALAALLLRGTVQMTVEKSPLGQRSASLSGSISAPNAATAIAHARAFIPDGVILRTDNEVTSSAVHNATPETPATIAAAFATVTFSYAWGAAHEDITGISYTDVTAPDYTAMTQERTISGQCHAPDKATAQAQVAALLTALSLSNPVKESLTHGHERQFTPSPATTLDRWLVFDFSYSFITGITGEIAHDIIRAQWRIARTGQVDHKPMVEVPLEYPVELAANGYNIGTLVASGSCQARVQATARTWGQEKRAAVATFGAFTGAEDPPQEIMDKNYVPFNGLEATFYEFSFTYSFRYREGLAGLWPSSGLTL
jgi:hypothetical protein